MTIVARIIRPMQQALVAGAVAVGVLVAGADRADACTSDGETGMDGFAILPADGATAPPNARVWLSSEHVFPGWGVIPDGNDFTLEVEGTAIPADELEIAVHGEVDAILLVLTPSEPLADGALVDVVWSNEQEGRREVLSRFAVAGAADTTAPDRPVVTDVQVDGGYFGACWCGSASRATVATQPGADLTIMVAGDASIEGIPGAAIAVGAGEIASATALGAGTTRVRVVAFDLAGNASPPSDLIDLPTPPETSGCASTARGALSSWAPVAIVLLLLAARSHRRPLTCR